MATEIELETREIHEKLDELREEHEHGGDFARLIRYVALTVGIMAVLAAVSAQQAATLATDALLRSNQSVLAQAKASDGWNEYQADSIKSHEYETQALVAGANGKQYSDLATGEKNKQPPLMEEAQKLESERDALLNESQVKNAVHETFARSVGSMQIGIALASIAALTRRREMWWLGSGFGLIGAGLLGYGFVGGTL
jgi:threonine aldolase